MARDALHLPHLCLREIILAGTLFLAPQFVHEIILNSGTALSSDGVSGFWTKAFMKSENIASFSVISTPMPFLSADIDDLVVLFTMPLREDILPSGKKSLISRVVSGANPFCVLIKIPSSAKLLEIPVKTVLPELNLTSSLFVNL